MMKLRRWIISAILLLIVLISTGVAGESCQVPVLQDGTTSYLQKDLETLMTPMLEMGKVGIYIKSLTDDQVIYEVNAETELIPASNQKIVTSIGAYYLVGPEYQYRTELYLAEQSLTIGDMYFGDLAIKGYGDPMLDYSALLQLFKESPLVEVKNINGNVYIDDTVFDAERFSEDWDYKYAKEVGALILRDTSHGMFDDLSETVPMNVGRMVQRIFHVLRIKHKGKIFAGQQMPEAMKLIASVESEPLLTLMGYGNKASDNSILEQIFKTISAVKLGQGTVAGSEQLLKEFYASVLGLDPAKYVVGDGSGLSRMNMISPQYLGKMLEYVYYHPYLDQEITSEEVHKLLLADQHPYLNTLAIAGEEGTLSERLQGLRVYGKTGTLNEVDALSGYVVTASDNVVLFSILINDFSVEREELRAWEDALVRTLFEYY